MSGYQLEIESYEQPTFREKMIFPEIYPDIEGYPQSSESDSNNIAKPVEEFLSLVPDGVLLSDIDYDLIISFKNKTSETFPGARLTDIYIRQPLGGGTELSSDKPDLQIPTLEPGETEQLNLFMDSFHMQGFVQTNWNVETPTGHPVFVTNPGQDLEANLNDLTLRVRVAKSEDFRTLYQQSTFDKEILE